MSFCNQNGSLKNLMNLKFQSDYFYLVNTRENQRSFIFKMFAYHPGVSYN